MSRPLMSHKWFHNVSSLRHFLRKPIAPNLSTLPGSHRCDIFQYGLLYPHKPFNGWCNHDFKGVKSPKVLCHTIQQIKRQCVETCLVTFIYDHFPKVAWVVSSCALAIPFNIHLKCYPSVVYQRMNKTWIRSKQPGHWCMLHMSSYR